MAEKNFYFAIEDGSTVFTEYKSDLHRIDKTTAKQKIIEYLNMYGCAGTKVETSDTAIKGVTKIDLTYSNGTVKEIYAGIGNIQTGGAGRNNDEFRIQLNGDIYNDLYQKRIQGKTTVLFGVYYWNSKIMLENPDNNYDGQYVVCAWEPTQTESTSPLSKQIKVSTISRAIKTGFAQSKGQIVTCAFKPEMIYFFIENSSWLTQVDIKTFPTEQFPDEEIKEITEDNNIEQHQSSDKIGKNIILYGVPGVGKSHEIKTKYCNDDQFIERVVFHPDYTYSDFVGQILPTYDEDTEKLKYKYVQGPFTKILSSAVNDPDNCYYLIIEEINRGNAPAIFGDIFQLLDRRIHDSDDGLSKAGESEYGITNFDIAREVYNNPAHQVKIPSNLFLLATMNTADQNVFTLDTAFQRRWELSHIKNDVKSAEHANQSICDSDITWFAFVDVVNEQIMATGNSFVSSGDKRLGAYFAREYEIKDSKKFSEKVLKYLWDDAVKMDHEKLFQEKFATADEMIDVFEEGTGNNSFEQILKPDVFKKMLERTNLYTNYVNDTDDTSSTSEEVNNE